MNIRHFVYQEVKSKSTTTTHLKDNHQKMRCVAQLNAVLANVKYSMQPNLYVIVSKAYQEQVVTV
jgi:hypothetical protein